MNLSRTSGAFLMPGAVPLELDRAPVGHVGIVCDDLDAVAAYLSDPLGPYVVIRSVADVPATLGGLAILTHELLTPELVEALSRATGVTK